MNRRNALIKTARFAKAHKLKTNTVMVMFAAIILGCYLKDFILKIAGCVLAPFKFVYGVFKSVLKKIFAFICKLCKRNRIKILKAECTFLTVSFILVFIFNKSYLQSMWGDENTGVFALGTEEYLLTEEEDTLSIEELALDMAGEESDDTEQEQTSTAVTEKESSTEDILPKTLLDQPLYYIALNRAQNTVTIYTYDETGEYNVPVKAMACSTGGDETPLGTYTLSDKFKFAALQYNSYGQYCTRITGAILFHSSTYTALSKDTLNAADYNQLGESVSHGCIRLTTADAKWIYDNCEAGTVVTIYDGDDAGPLGKPETIKVPEDTLWDPTDPDTENPWNDKKPVISGASNKTVYEYDEYDVMEGITAVDTCGNDITDEITVEGTVDMEVPGVYTVTYRVEDALGRIDEVTVEITVI